MKNIKFVLYALLLLSVLLRQVQMQHEINRLRDSEIQFREQMIQFMETTNRSIENHTAAIESGTRTMKILAGIR